MTRGRKPLPPAEQPLVVIDEQRLRADMHAGDTLMALDAAALARTTMLATRLGYQGPLEPDLLEHGIGQQMRRTVQACLETGAMLLLLKERTPHGDFQMRIERLGIAPRAAQRFMQASLKFAANASAPTHLLNAVGSEAKLIELLVLDDEQVSELLEDGSTLGITVDEIGAMSQKELRAALREAREDLAAKDELVKAKNDKIDKLLSARKFKPDADSIARNEAERKLLDELHESARAFEVLAQRLGNVYAGIGTRPSVGLDRRRQQVLEWLAAQIADLANTWGITLDLAAAMDLRPDWVKAMDEGDGAENRLPSTGVTAQPAGGAATATSASAANDH